jgi:hypothetical protein
VTPGDQRPVVRLSVWEQMRFLLIVDRETHRPARRLLDLWAQPEDLGPHVEQLLTETLRAMWRRPLTEPGEPTA